MHASTGARTQSHSHTHTHSQIYLAIVWEAVHLMLSRTFYLYTLRVSIAIYLNQETDWSIMYSYLINLRQHAT